ncbi:unnamed protein product [Cunninghamella blakesleeana]
MSVLYTVFLITGLLISGVAIPLILTYQDHQKVDEEKDQYFTQPLLQTVFIFLGEIICIFGIQVVSKASSWLDRSLLDSVQATNTAPRHRDEGNDWVVPRTTSWFCSSIWFILPSAFDLIATTLLNLGLIFTTPSIFQMVRSSIVGFSAVFSFIFLSRRFLKHEWISVVTILSGIGIISYYAASSAKEEGNGILHHDCYWIGPVLLLTSQLFVASQFILEEYLMDKYQLNPVHAMGIEGIFGTLLLGIAIIVAVFTPSSSDHTVFDIKAGVTQLIHSSNLWQSAILLAFAVAIFNFFGLAVSTSIGIPGRSVLDAIRTTLIWIIAVQYGYDTFSWVELIGFVVLVLGVFLFNGVFTNLYAKYQELVKGKSTTDERAPLLS